MGKSSCFCGHDCSRCLTYLATVCSDDMLRRQAQDFYREMFGRIIPLEQIRCFGGRESADRLFVLCRECPWASCCREKGIDTCAACDDYPCAPLEDYIKKYVNRCLQK